jgi:hypothetical protein
VLGRHDPVFARPDDEHGAVEGAERVGPGEQVSSASFGVARVLAQIAPDLAAPQWAQPILDDLVGNPPLQLAAYKRLVKAIGERDRAPGPSSAAGKVRAHDDPSRPYLEGIWKRRRRGPLLQRALLEDSASQLQALSGFLDANVLVRSLGDVTEVVVATVWESIDAVRAFAGDEDERAVVEPIVRDLLERFDDEITHFTLAVAARPITARTAP